MKIFNTLVTRTLKVILRTLCLVDDQQLQRVPDHGPLILIVNHINFLDVPVLATHLLPRPLTALVKSETWEKPLLRMLFNMWGAIPLRRGEADRDAFRKAERALSDGKILAIAPEGTRSRDGSLQQGHAGVVLLAQRTGAPLLPVVYYGNECFGENIRRLRRTDFHIVVGKPFNLVVPERLQAGERQVITDEIMYQLARLLPTNYRGLYNNLELASTRYIKFISEQAFKRTTPRVSFQPIG
jgi:1-acyl-sn-glycerol-3-phosphate acyltransferase